ncbi:MAG: hypothetical protein ABH914_02375 [Candidatus Omnitrophota bacterium]
MRLAIKIWKETVGILRKHPVVFLPFIIVGLCDAILVILLYLAPQYPFSVVLGPPIRAFLGEQYLHYPYNLLIIPRLFAHAHIVSTGIMGILMTGLAIGLIGEIKQGNKPSVLISLIRALKRYFVLLGVWLIMFGLSFVVYKFPNLFVALKNQLILQVAFYLSFFIVILIQVVFVYAFPAAVIEKKGLISAVKRGFMLTKQRFLATLLLVMLPSLLFVPVIIIKGNLGWLVQRLFPEVVLVVTGIGIVVTVVIDLVVTCATTVLFLQKE